ncbi:hypothetical protein [Arcticibacter eurypsychrophilus]|uniref:hypothetical protein n=1 Tax=Arcticibacter eurypsychrophilus TaxID=1434752 RepID=UPI00084D8E90|nr:hypothetical protein [Arcticibacter eurypsychrophilus]
MNTKYDMKAIDTSLLILTLPYFPVPYENNLPINQMLRSNFKEDPHLCAVKDLQSKKSVKVNHIDYEHISFSEQLNMSLPKFDNPILAHLHVYK